MKNFILVAVLFLCRLSLLAGGIDGSSINNLIGNGFALTNLNLATGTLTVSTNGKAQYTSITAACNAALPGYNILVFSGTYNENDFCRGQTNLNFFFFPGAALSFTVPKGDTNGWGFFDDRRLGPSTNTIYGSPAMYFNAGTNYVTNFNGSPVWADTPMNSPSPYPGKNGTLYGQDIGCTNSLGAVVLTNSASRLVGYFGDTTIVCGNQRHVANSPMGFSFSAFMIGNCQYCEIHTSGIYDPYNGTNWFLQAQTSDPSTGDLGVGATNYADNASQGVFWGLGETHVFCSYQGVLNSYSIWVEEPANGLHTNNFYYTGDVVQTPIYQAGQSPTWKNWINIKLLMCGFVLPGGYNAAIHHYGGYLYYTGDAIECLGGFCYCGNGVDFVVAGSSTNEAWIIVNKMVSGGCINGYGSGSTNLVANGYGNWIGLGGNASANSGGCVFANVQHYMDAGGSDGVGHTGVLQGFVIDGGELHLDGGYAKLLHGGQGLIYGPESPGLATPSCFINNITLDTSSLAGSTNYPVMVETNGLYLKNVTLVAPSSAESIVSVKETDGITINLTSETVAAMGVYSTTAIDSNVTLNPTNLWINSAVK